MSSCFAVCSWLGSTTFPRIPYAVSFQLEITGRVSEGRSKDMLELTLLLLSCWQPVLAGGRPCLCSHWVLSLRWKFDLFWLLHQLWLLCLAVMSEPTSPAAHRGHSTENQHSLVHPPWFSSDIRVPACPWHPLPFYSYLQILTSDAETGSHRLDFQPLLVHYYVYKSSIGCAHNSDGSRTEL